MIYLAIVDDKRPIRQSLQQRLSADPAFEILFTAENGVDFLEKMVEARKSVLPDLILMDIDMPVMDGIESVAQCKTRYPATKVLMLTVFDDDDKIFNAIRAGANGYLLKEEPLEKIKAAIHELVEEKGAPMSPSIARKTLQLLVQARLEGFSSAESQEAYNLSQREKTVLELLVEGLEYKEIGARMEVSPNTIRNHIVNIYRKLHVSSKAQAIRVYLGRNGQ